MGTYYSPYVNHCIRFYVKYPAATRFRTDADKLNWKAVSSALHGMPQDEVSALLEAYSGNDISGNIQKISKSSGVKKELLWKIVCDFERKVASKRGLI